MRAERSASSSPTTSTGSDPRSPTTIFVSPRVRCAGRDRGRPLTSASPRRGAPCGRRAGARAAAARTRAARRDRPGAHVDPPRAEAARGRGADEETRAPVGRSCASSSSTTLQDVRRLAVELRPAALDDFGLVPALERLARDLPRADGHRGRPRGAARRASGCRREVETALYRIVQEALTNVVKHARRDERQHPAHAPRRRGRRRDRGRRPRASIRGSTRDDGLGLLGMRERVALARRAAAIESAPGAGTTLSRRCRS